MKIDIPKLFFYGNSTYVCTGWIGMEIGLRKRKTKTLFNLYLCYSDSFLFCMSRTPLFRWSLRNWKHTRFDDSFLDKNNEFDSEFLGNARNHTRQFDLRQTCKIFTRKRAPPKYQESRFSFSLNIHSTQNSSLFFFSHKSIWQCVLDCSTVRWATGLIVLSVSCARAHGIHGAMDNTPKNYVYEGFRSSANGMEEG